MLDDVTGKVRLALKHTGLSLSLVASISKMKKTVKCELEAANFKPKFWLKAIDPSLTSVNQLDFLEVRLISISEESRSDHRQSSDSVIFSKLIFFVFRALKGHLRIRRWQKSVVLKKTVMISAAPPPPRPPPKKNNKYLAWLLCRKRKRWREEDNNG